MVRPMELRIHRFESNRPTSKCRWTCQSQSIRAQIVVSQSNLANVIQHVNFGLEIRSRSDKVLILA